jgi:integrase
MAKILSDAEVFEQFSDDKSRKAYRRCWERFVAYNSEFDFEDGPPGEELLTAYFKYLRFEKKTKSSSVWTFYSYINSVMKRKYSFKLQEFPRLTMMIKGFVQDEKNKAMTFDEALIRKFMVSKMENAYWEVRQAITIMAFFGGLRMAECMTLKLERIKRGPEGYTVSHSRVKQRSDKRDSKFLVPEDGGFAAQLDIYLSKVEKQLKVYKGKVWWTGTKHDTLKSMPMGKNMFTQMPHLVAELLSLPEPDKYTFHSFRRTAATSAADASATSDQMVDFFGWKNQSMCSEYISTSKPAIVSMASKLAGPVEPFKMDDPEVVVEVEVENSKEMDVKSQLQEMVMVVMEEDQEMLAMAGIQLQPQQQMDPLIVWEEDLEMYAMAGLPNPAIPNQQAIIEASVKQAIAAIPNVKGTTINVVLVNGNNTMNF